MARYGEKVGQVAGKERAVEDDVARREGVRRDAHLDADERGKQDRRQGEGCQGQGVAPALVGARIEANEESNDSRHEGGSAEKVDASNLGTPMGMVGSGEIEDEVDCNKGSGTDGNLAEEGPAPTDRIGKETAEGCRGLEGAQYRS
ncbi:predicted protein [Verticillium alfalfae VaMs.102]|uniref:Predicted protein n=1 Tax=Verticillium alfalfae (strain VaMs.102 / ATCC MYA-4576 / FGSC 10136) TaxID=526221 RepID=C9SVC6_VERA1|nr:predicted protein [Verticillium alfalfae VaMs.102]EEY22741.1 predicted protein [Verticillium alfalfae VaMs.102]